MTIAASGGMLLISDDMTLLDENSAKLFQTVARIGKPLRHIIHERQSRASRRESSCDGEAEVAASASDQGNRS